MRPGAVLPQFSDTQLSSEYQKRYLALTSTDRGSPGML